MLRYQSYASNKTSLQLAIKPQIDWQQQTEDPLETPLHVSYCDKTVSEHKCEQLPADKFILSSAFFVSLKISYGETACSKLWLVFLYIYIYREKHESFLATNRTVTVSLIRNMIGNMCLDL